MARARCAGRRLARAGAPRPSRRGGRPTNRRLCLANGADGLQVIFAGAGRGLRIWPRQSILAALHRAFEGVRLTACIELGRRVRGQATGFAGIRGRADPATSISFGLDPLGPALARSGRAARAGGGSARAREARAVSQGQAVRRNLPRHRRRCVHAAGGTPAQVSRLRSAQRLLIRARSAKTAFRLTPRAPRSRFA